MQVLFTSYSIREQYIRNLPFFSLILRGFQQAGDGVKNRSSLSPSHSVLVLSRNTGFDAS